MKIVYYTYGDINVPSSRLRAYYVAQELTKQNNTVLLNSRNIQNDADIVVIQKRSDLSWQMKKYRSLNIPVILDISDNVRLPINLAALITAGSIHIQNKHQNSIFIPDVVDIKPPASLKTSHGPLSKVVWFGGPENAIQATNIAKACSKLNLEFVTITNHKSKHFNGNFISTRKEWSLDTVDGDIIGGDLVVCPFLLDQAYKTNRTNEYLCSKSRNRLIKAWALGMPVAGSPLPDYIDAGLKYVATTVDEWIKVLDILNDVELRKEDAKIGQLLAKQYSAELISEQWLKVFKDLVNEKDRIYMSNR